MDPNDRKFLQDNLFKLSENCNFSNILGCLRAHFTQKQLEYYESGNFQILGEEQKCQKLFTDIQTRGPNAFYSLQECFRVTRHDVHYKLITRGRRGHLDTLPQELVKQSTFLHEGDDVYKMSSNPKGKFIFINNLTFQVHSDREGADWDTNFQDYLIAMGYQGDCYPNKTTQEMRQLLQAFAGDESLSEVDSCMVIIGSHGGVSDSQELIVHGCDHEPQDPLLCNEIINLFHSDTCKLRPGCPKIFIFQACRGDGQVKDGKLEGLSEVRKAPQHWVDTFLLAPCVEGLKANRDPMSGSWLFLALKDTFRDHAHNVDLQSMRNLINEKFDQYFEGSTPRLQQTLAYYEYGVSKKLFFNPGVYKQ